MMCRKRVEGKMEAMTMPVAKTSKQVEEIEKNQVKWRGQSKVEEGRGSGRWGRLESEQGQARQMLEILEAERAVTGASEGSQGQAD
jgi:hypothetical protein